MTGQCIRWHELTPEETYVLSTGPDDHEIDVLREALPIVFVPGVMGSLLKQRQEETEGDEEEDPTVVWNPDSYRWAAAFAFKGAAARKALLIGDEHDPRFLDVHEINPDDLPGPDNLDRWRRGWGGVHADSYHAYFQWLEQQLAGGSFNTDFGNYFDLPLYAVGYNWTASARLSGLDLATRIQEIITENNNEHTFCEKVIVVTHSMGGLVTRAALHYEPSAAGKVLGVVHGVQPVTGGAAAYKRVRAGFAGGAGLVLGHNADRITAIFANAPGPLQLLPNKQYVANDDSRRWLRFFNGIGESQPVFSLPASDPYAEIYRQQDVWWRLVDPLLIDPGRTMPSIADAWGSYIANLQQAETFHDAVRLSMHNNTYQIYGSGVGHATYDRVPFEFRPEGDRIGVPVSQSLRQEIAANYSTIRPESHSGWTTNIRVNGTNIDSVMRDPPGEGDGTVPLASGSALPEDDVKGDRAVPNIDHQGAYGDATVRALTVTAITRMVKEHFDSRVGG